MATTAADRPDARTEPATSVRGSIVKAINERVPGTVILHYASRDVAITASGDTALRMMIAFRRQRADDLTDPIDLGHTVALTGWTTIRHADLLAISWDPGEDAEKAVGPELLELLEQMESIEKALPPGSSGSTTKTAAADPTEADAPAKATDGPRDGEHPS